MISRKVALSFLSVFFCIDYAVGVVDLLADDFKYSGDPVTIMCVDGSDPNNLTFVEAQFSKTSKDAPLNGMPTHFLDVLKGNNRPKLALYFDGFLITPEDYRNPDKPERYREFAFEWFNKDKELNICYVLYRYAVKPTGVREFLTHVAYLANDNRFEFVVRVGWMLVKDFFFPRVVTVNGRSETHGYKELIKDNLILFGFSLGVPLASYLARQIKKPNLMNVTVSFLYEWDPAGVGLALGDRMPRADDADNVMAVHSDTAAKGSGTATLSGKVDIFIHGVADRYKKSLHHIPAWFHRLVATGRITLCCAPTEQGVGILYEDYIGITTCGKVEMPYGVRWKGEFPNGQRTYGLNWNWLTGITDRRYITSLPTPAS